MFIFFIINTMGTNSKILGIYNYKFSGIYHVFSIDSMTRIVRSVVQFCAIWIYVIDEVIVSVNILPKMIVFNILFLLLMV